MNIHNFISSFKNAQNSNLEKFKVKKSILILNVVSLLAINGYIMGYSENKNDLEVYLKYPVVNKIDMKMVSKASKRVYVNYRSVQKDFYTTDLLLVSTKYGILTNKELAFMKIGGEVLIKVVS